MLVLLYTSLVFFFLMIRRPPRSTRTDTLFPYTTLFRSDHWYDVYGGMIPSNHRRWCTKMLKLKPFEDFVGDAPRSEEHTSELQSLMRISYAVFCLKKKKTKQIDRQLKTHIISNIYTNEVSIRTDTQPK